MKNNLEDTSEFLIDCASLSSRLNLQINSLEKRKNVATSCIELMTDLYELDSSVKMV